MLHRTKARAFCLGAGMLFLAICLVTLSAGVVSAQENSGSIEGTVTDEAGNPLADIYIAAYEYDEEFDYWDYYNTTYSNEDGTYQLTDLGSENVRVSFSSSEYVDEYYDNATDLDSATDIQVTVGVTVTGIDAQLAPYPSVSGQITDIDGNPLSDIQVRAYRYDVDYDEWRSYRSSSSDEDGRYKLVELSVATTRIGFESSDYIDEYYENTENFDLATNISIEVGQAITGINAQLLARPSISGNVTNEEGSPLPNIEVTAYQYNLAYDDWDEIASTNSEDDGSYTLTGLATGNVRVQFDSNYSNSSGYISEYYDNAASLGLATNIAVVAGENVAEIDAQLTAYPSISGKVTNEEGTPLPDIRVVALWDYDEDYYEWNSSSDTETDVSGVYTLTGPMTGDIYVSFYDRSLAYGHEYYDNANYLDTATAISVANGETVAGIDAQLAPHPTISGQVTDENGNPIEGIRVTFYYYEPDDPFYAEWQNYNTILTDQNGEYFLEQADAGINRIHYNDSSSYSGVLRYKSEYYNNAETFETATDILIANGDNLVLETVQLEALGSISGTVSDQNGNPLEVYVTVEAWNSQYENWERVSSERTNSDGSYIISKLDPGSYHVRFSEGSYDYYDDYDEIFVREYYNNAYDRASATAVVIEAGNDVIDIDAQMAMKPIIQGTVTDIDGNPLEDAPVTYYERYDNVLLYDDETGEEYYGIAWVSQGSTETDSSGLYTLGVAPHRESGFAEAYRICAGRYYSGYLSQCYPGANVVESATDIAVNVNETVSDIDVSLIEPSTITGTVTNANSEPLGYVYVGVYRYQEATDEWVEIEPDYPYTDSDGGYSVGGLYAGLYRLRFDGDETYQTQFYSGSLTIEGATDIEVGTAETVSGINVELVERTYIAGTVTDENGYALQSVPVGVYRKYGGTTTLPPVTAAQVSGLASHIYSAPTNEYWELVRSAVTDPEGNYFIYDLPVGSYRVGFSTAGSLYHREFYGANAYYIDQATDIILDVGTRLEDISVQLAGMTLNVTPRAVADEITVAGVGASANVAGTSHSLLVNDEDAEDGILTAFLVETPSHGTLDLKPDGTFTYTHDGSGNPTDSFTYKVSDGETESEAVTVTIQVLGDTEAESTDVFLYLPVMQK